MHSIKDIIETLPDTAKRSVLQSVVSSLNCKVIGTAASTVARLTTGGYDFRELEPREVVTLINGIDDEIGDTGSTLLSVRRTLRIAQDLRDELVKVTNNDNDGAMTSSLDFMTKVEKQRKVDMSDPDVVAMLGVIKLNENDIKRAEAAQFLNDVQRAEKLAERRGSIEWLIEHVFEGHGLDVHDECDGTPQFVSEADNNLIASLSPEDREAIYGKVGQALHRARDNTIKGVLFSDRRFSFGDMPLIDAAIKEVETLH